MKGRFPYVGHVKDKFHQFFDTFTSPGYQPQLHLECMIDWIRHLQTGTGKLYQSTSLPLAGHILRCSTAAAEQVDASLFGLACNSSGAPVESEELA